MNFLTGIINHKVAINLLRTHFEKQIKEKVTDFEVNYNAEKQTIYFTIKGKKYLFDNPMLKEALINSTKTMLKKADKLLYLKLLIDTENNINANIYIIDVNNERVCLTKKL
jgi:hypothetical protein